ncbi:hypothetical protein JCM11491_005249 [Sporobolomyces phaffii]
MPPLPTLPTELINEILLESVLSEGDLVRCCLVSRQFLPIAQQLLYYSVEFTSYIVTSSDVLVGTTLCALSPRSRALLNTLALSTSLANLVRHLILLPPDRSLDFYEPEASRLEVIRLPIQAASTTLSGFKHLRHVAFHHTFQRDFKVPSTVSIADCTALKTLAFQFLLNPSKSHLLAFLLASPASLTRLEFPRLIPFDVLTSLLDHSVRPPFRLEVLALSAGTASKPNNAVQFANVRSLCDSQGIKIELMRRSRDVFYV